MKIEEIDKNFKTAEIGGAPIRFFNAIVPPFVLEGFAWHTPGKPSFYRLPENILTTEQVNEGALWLAHNTPGGAIRFRTDAKTIALRAKLVYSSDMNHMPRAGSAGFDIYRGVGKNSFHVGTVQPCRDQEKVEQIACLNPLPGEMADFTLNFPLYGGAENIEIGIEPGARIEPPTPRAVTDPVLFYGSSITQGGCASRPGNNYCSMLCRAVDAPQINLGFSGCGRGEPKIAELISELKLSAFVFDYDHNAPNPEHLLATHEPFFRIVRAKQPELPVIFMSMCNTWFEFNNARLAVDRKRRDIIRATYDHAVANGDRNVYFIDGAELFGTEDRTDCTVDGCHPNDLGFHRMYRAVLPILRKALNIKD